ncbi:uncharacterized protein LOC125263695 isoform X2 [Megalobrama amblycephala]|nr:uncharacterized protein LOC125263695 isoform X2 [Megalobrama amblycephala]
MNEEREKRRKEMRELIRVEKEKEAEIHNLQRTLEEKRAQLQRLNEETERAESELEEQTGEQQLATIKNTLSGILDRAGGSGSSSRVTDPVEQLEVIGQMHQFFKTAETKTNKKSRVKPARCQK